MDENLKKISELIKKKDKINKKEFENTLTNFLHNHVKKNHIDEYIGGFPSIIEPVVFGKNVTLGDDVLLGPNVYIGDNSEIGDYNEISNAIILDSVKLGEIFKLDKCIIASDSKLNFTSLNINNCIIEGKTSSKENLDKKSFE